MLMAAATEQSAVSDWKQAFSGAYQSRNDAHDALRDIKVFEGLGDDGIAIRLVSRTGADGTLGLKFYHEGTAIPLSDRVPMLEHFGFRVIDERTYTIVPRDGVERYLHDMVVELAGATETDVLARAQAGDASVFPQLMQLATEPGKPTIIRATATLALGDFPSQETLQVIQSQLSAEDQLVRAAAVRSLDMMQAVQRYSLLQPLISDPSKSVRMEVARQLSETPTEQLPPEYVSELDTLKKEYVEALKLNSDMPEAQMNLGVFYTATGDSLAAEAAYRQAVRLSPAFVPALLNLADLYRANGMDEQARPLIEKAIRLAPTDPAAHHAMGLLLVRQRQLDQAVPYLAKAADLGPVFVRYTYVYAVALYENGQPEEAISVLEAALEKQPGNRDLISALAGYYQQQGNEEKLRALIR